MNKTLRRSALVASVMIGGLAAGIGLGLWRIRPEPVTQAEWLFDLSFPDVNGQSHSLSQLRGRLTIVNFWATWCPPCIQEMPELSAFHTEWSEKGVNVIGLAVDSPSNVRAFLTDRQFEYPLLIAGAAGSELARQLGSRIDALPYTAMLDRNGSVLAQKMGRITEDELKKWVESAL